MTFYRDPLAGLRSQIATKRGLLESRERSLPALFRAMLPEKIAAVIRDLRERAMAEPESLDGLTSTDAALDEILNAHAEAAELVPKLRECPDDVPDPAKPEMSPPWIFEEGWQLSFRYAFTKRLEQISSDAFVVRWDDSTYLSRFRITGAPLVMSSRLVLLVGHPATFHSAIRSSVPPETPKLEVRRSDAFDGIGKLVGMVHDEKTGEEVFDRTFIVDGSPATIALLTPDVRTALTTLEAGSNAPKVVVHRGVVDLRFHNSNHNNPQEIMPDAALAVVLGIRAAIERA